MASGDRVDPYAQFSFVIKIDGIDVGAFTEVDGLDAESEVIEYRTGSEEHRMRKLPGLMQYSNITLKRGITDNDELWQWRKSTLDGETERRNGAIVLRNEVGEAVLTWKFREGWVVKYEGPALDASSSEVAVETVEICHEGLEFGD